MPLHPSTEPKPPLTVDVERLRLLALADGVADLALDDGAVLAPVQAVQPQQGPVVTRHDGVRQEPPGSGTFLSVLPDGKI